MDRTPHEANFLIGILNYNRGQNICDKLQFSCEIVHDRKSFISIFQEVFANIDKILILGGGLATRLSFYDVLKF